MIKLIASDIDGTLVPDGYNKLNTEYFDVILKLKEQGIIFAAASGRQYSSIAKLFEPVKDNMIFIAENGSYVTCRGEDMSVSVMDRDIIHQLIRDIRSIPECEISLSGKHFIYVESTEKGFLNLLIHEYRNEVEQVTDLLEVKEDFIKISIFHKTDATGAAGNFIIPKWKDQLEIVCAGNQWLDIMNYNVSKGEAIKKIQKQLNITKEETMVFGDNLNDIAMLKQAGESYAIGNAREEVKQAAKHVADTNVNDGVLQVIKALLK
ncbi:hypothetical protein EDD66_11732 [Mobilisporobacter senegalensis]|uniref:Cof subfamily protein (Haloacid dehalogenase superfamily)/HAD superfamily hydrolase (TIGR01484 family) n=1 Tax=Mobilisporobacter senegalensis TaxID=1329262 RepID=A0A3N1X5R2_9FIRM|nr:HAD family hydrolase [Mobilisporobacter senegalensis]ROR22120.1 hypothetical protein EDD66_11732 [Mobilisporobacter senegalensis]